MRIQRATGRLAKVKIPSFAEPSLRYFLPAAESANLIDQVRAVPWRAPHRLEGTVYWFRREEQLRISSNRHCLAQRLHHGCCGENRGAMDAAHRRHSRIAGKGIGFSSARQWQCFATASPFSTVAQSKLHHRGRCCGDSARLQHPSTRAWRTCLIRAPKPPVIRRRFQVRAPRYRARRREGGV